MARCRSRASWRRTGDSVQYLVRLKYSEIANTERPIWNCSCVPTRWRRQRRSLSLRTPTGGRIQTTMSRLLPNVPKEETADDQEETPPER